MHKPRIIITPSAAKLGEAVNTHLNQHCKTKENYIANTDFVRFSNGEGKCVIKDDLAGCDIYIISDPSNYGASYDLIKTPHHMSPDEHFSDIKRAISALRGQACRINIIMPLLYQSRQDKRKIKESLDCAMALKELEWYGVKNIITVDIHSLSVENAIPFNTALHNSSALDILLDSFKSTIKYDNLFVVSPDSGAKKKADYAAKYLGINKSGSFEKRRNYEIVKDGQNPIEFHEFIGPSSLKNHDILLVDDMIASGASLLSSIKLLKKLHANKIHLMVSYSLFTSGIDSFIKANAEKEFDTLFTTNLSYIPDEYSKYDFIHIVDCSAELAKQIELLNSTL